MMIAVLTRSFYKRFNQPSADGVNSTA